MTDQSLHESIYADPQAKSLADSGADAACASRMAAILPPTPISTVLDEAGVLDVLGPSEGDASLSAIEAASTNPGGPYGSLLGRIVRILRNGSPGGIDFGDPDVRAMLATLQAAGILTADAATKLLAAATAPPRVTADDVSRAWAQHRPNGKITGLPS